MTDTDKMQLMFGLSALLTERNAALRELDAARAEVERLRGQVHCRGCDGTVGDHLAPDQGGCTGRFVIDGVEMVPAQHKETNQ